MASLTGEPATLSCGSRGQVSAMPESAVVVLVSPQDYAHFPGCPHKGADPDMSMWGKISEPGAWDQLRDGREMTAVFAGWTETKAWRRCKDCVAHGPWE